MRPSFAGCVQPPGSLDRVLILPRGIRTLHRVSIPAGGAGYRKAHLATCPRKVGRFFPIDSNAARHDWRPLSAVRLAINSITACAPRAKEFRQPQGRHHVAYQRVSDLCSNQRCSVRRPISMNLASIRCKRGIRGFKRCFCAETIWSRRWNKLATISSEWKCCK